MMREEGPFVEMSDETWEVTVDLLVIMVANSQGFLSDEAARVLVERIVDKHGPERSKEAMHAIRVEHMALGWEGPDIFKL